MRLGVIGFLFHLPGLKLFAHATVSPLVLKLNAVALALTLAAMGVAWLEGLSVIAAWLAGHLSWSCALVALTREGHVR